MSKDDGEVVAADVIAKLNILVVTSTILVEGLQPALAICLSLDSQLHHIDFVCNYTKEELPHTISKLDRINIITFNSIYVSIVLFLIFLVGVY